MTNKKVEELVRKKYCLRDCDTVKVEFQESNIWTEEFNVTDTIAVDGNEFTRHTLLVVSKTSEFAVFRVGGKIV